MAYNAFPPVETPTEADEAQPLLQPTVSMIPKDKPLTGMEIWRLISNCAMGFGNGLNDSAPGALLPYIQEDYSIGYAIVSLLFVSNAAGYIVAAPQAHHLEKNFGRAWGYAISELLMALGYTIILCHPPFWGIIIAFFFIGVGEAFDLALNNVFCANLGGGASALGALHGCYGLGGTVGPFVATSIVVAGGPWFYLYGVAILITILNAIFATATFWKYEDDLAEQDACRSPSGDEIIRSEHNHSITVETNGILRQALLSRVTLLGAIFIFAYQGAEVSVSGWIIEFLIHYRNGDPAAVGYVTVGFWGGIALGRFFFSPLAHKFGLKVSVVFMSVGCLLMQILVWCLPSIIGDSVIIAMIGLLLGPIYPCAMAVFNKLLQPHLQITSLGFISSMGSSGGAVAPLLVGLLAQSMGTFILHPICVALYAIMLASWVVLIRK
jgi:fucose permease